MQPEEQQALRRSRVAVAGLGGVGGAHLVTLARLGVGHFHIADFDVFEAHNLNRQAGAFGSTIGKPKVEVMRAMALDINPAADINAWGEAITAGNVEAFLRGADVVVDGLDFFALEARSTLYREARGARHPRRRGRADRLQCGADRVRARRHDLARFLRHGARQK